MLIWIRMRRTPTKLHECLVYEQHLEKIVSCAYLIQAPCQAPLLVALWQFQISMTWA